MNKNLHYLQSLRVKQLILNILTKLTPKSSYLLVLLLVFSFDSFAQRNVIGLLNKYNYPGCGDNDPVFSVAAKLGSGSYTSDLYFYGGNIGWITPYYTGGTNGCGSILIFNTCNTNETQTTYKWKSSDEDNAFSYYCDHNSNSCVATERTDAFTFTNNTEGALSDGRFPTFTSASNDKSSQIEASIVWANSRNEGDYGTDKWVASFYDNSNLTTYRGYMVYPEIFDMSFRNGAQDWDDLDYRLFCGSGYVNTTSFSARYRMTKNFTSCGFYSFTVGHHGKRK
jgi:hypothetical protein